MKKIALWSSIAVCAVAGIFIAADHLDAPAVRMQTTDIADFYAFEGNNSDATTFIVTIPAADATSQFDENVLIEINIDNTGVDDPTAPGVTEDLVIQALRQGNQMFFFGPYEPNETGLNSTIDTNEFTAAVDIGSQITTGGVSYFAGQRQDAFFFDFEEFNNVVGNAPAAGFNDNPANNTFAPLNTNAIVIEIPNSMLGTAPVHIVDQLLGTTTGLPAAYNVWVETKRR